MRFPPAIALLLLCSALPVQARQAAGPPSHEAMLTRITAACLEQAIADHGAFRFLPQGESERVASPLVATWTDGGKTVFLEPSASETPLLVVTTDQSSIALHRKDRNTVRRQTSVDLTWWLSSTDGDVMGTDTCRDTREDELSRMEAAALAVPGSPIFDPDLPPRSRIWGSVLNVAEPVVLLGATAVGTYLLFNLRSRRSDNG